MISSIHKSVFLCRTLCKEQCYQKKNCSISKGVIPLHGGIVKKRSVCVSIIQINSSDAKILYLFSSSALLLDTFDYKVGSE